MTISHKSISHVALLLLSAPMHAAGIAVKAFPWLVVGVRLAAIQAVEALGGSFTARNWHIQASGPILNVKGYGVG